MRKHRQHRRRGSAYLLVLGAALVVSVLSLSNLLALRIERRTVEDTAASTKARLYAQAGIELGMQQIDENPTWRSSKPHGAWLTGQEIGDGTYSIEVTDPADGDLSDSDADSIVIGAVGECGPARQKTKITLVPVVQGYNCLEVTLHAAGPLNLNNLTLTCDQTICSDQSVTAFNSAVNADVEAVESIVGETYNGQQTEGIDSREMPTTTVFTPYMDAGTPISVDALPLSASVRVIENVLLSAASNPFGQANPEGVYVLDCQGQDLVIRNSRLVATLLVNDPGPGSKIEGSVPWTAPLENYPALLVSGNMALELADTPLSEDTQVMNFNPTGTPYEGATDDDMVDDYPSVVEGLIYASGNLTLANHPTIYGSVVAGGSIDAAELLDLSYRSIYMTDPPPGFVDTTLMKVVPGSWQRNVD